MNSDIVAERLERTKRLERDRLVVCTGCTPILYEQWQLLKNMLQISQKQLEKFRQVKNLYFNKTKVPAADNWQDWNDDDVWCHLVSQVITVGNSFPAQRFEKKRARYELLEEGTVRKTIAKKPPHVNHPVYVITAKGRRAYDETSKVRARPLKLSDF